MTIFMTKYDHIYDQNFSFKSKKIVLQCFRSEIFPPHPPSGFHMKMKLDETFNFKDFG